MRTARLACLVLLAACWEDKGTYDYSEWDENADEQVVRDEFGRNFGDTWAGWDEAGDGLTEDEWARVSPDEAGNFEAWDTDGDGVLSREEAETGLFDSWDADRSNSLTEDEWGWGA